MPAKHVTVKAQSKSKAPIVTRYSRWVRLYTSIRHDPKIGMLSDHQFRAWINILMIAGETEGGKLPPVKSIAFELRTTPDRAQQLIDDLIDVGLIDVAGRAGDILVLVPHNWTARQFQSDTSTERSRRHRERTRQQVDATGCNVAETFQQQNCSVPALTSVSDSELSIQGSKNATYQTRETWPTADDEVPL